MSYACVGLVAPPLLDREITALSKCACGGRILSGYVLCTCRHFSMHLLAQARPRMMQDLTSGSTHCSHRVQEKHLMYLLLYTLTC